MTAIEFLIFLVFTALFVGAQTRQNTKSTEPTLPIVNEAMCPGHGRIVADWELQSRQPIYSTWKSNRTKLGDLVPKEKVTVLEGVSITQVPDRVVVTRSIPDLALKPGDIILRYDTMGEVANIWSKGIWHHQYDLWRTVDSDGSGCGAVDTCDSHVVKDGVKEWWIRVRTRAGITGWTVDSKTTNGAFWTSGNFGNLCGD